MYDATGKSKSLEDITIEDVLKDPIWVLALDEEGVEGQDETWQKPVTGATDVSPELVSFFLTLNILFKVVGAELNGSGDYDHERGEISGFALWQNGDWRPMLREVEGLEFPVIFEAVPTIYGKPGVRFVCETEDDRIARRID